MADDDKPQLMWIVCDR